MVITPSKEEERAVKLDRPVTSSKFDFVLFSVVGSIGAAVTKSDQNRVPKQAGGASEVNTLSLSGQKPGSSSSGLKHFLPASQPRPITS
jgi:hypothetical protein